MNVHVLVIVPNLSRTGSITLDGKSHTYLKLGHPQNFGSTTVCCARNEGPLVNLARNSQRAQTTSPSNTFSALRRHWRIFITVRENSRSISRCAVASRQIAWASPASGPVPSAPFQTLRYFFYKRSEVLPFVPSKLGSTKRMLTSRHAREPDLSVGCRLGAQMASFGAQTMTDKGLSTAFLSR